MATLFSISLSKSRFSKRKITMKFLTLPLLLVSLPLSHADTKFTIASDTVSCGDGPFQVTTAAITCGEYGGSCTWGSDALVEGLGKLAAAMIHSF
jgi:hypothetical protein